MTKRCRCGMLQLDMDAHLLDRVIKQGDIERLHTGATGVRVSLQYEPKLATPSFPDRKMELKREFERIAQTLNEKGAEVDLNSISVSGQTVEAVLPVDQLDEIESDLSDKSVRVDLLVN